MACLLKWNKNHFWDNDSNSVVYQNMRILLVTQKSWGRKIGMFPSLPLKECDNHYTNLPFLLLKFLNTISILTHGKKCFYIIYIYILPIFDVVYKKSYFSRLTVENVSLILSRFASRVIWDSKLGFQTTPELVSIPWIQ